MSRVSLYSTMFSEFSVPVLPAFAGSDAYYEHQQLQTANRAPCRNFRYHPYTRTSSHTNGTDYLGTSYLGYQCPYLGDISLEHYYKESAHLAQGFPKIEKLGCGTTRSEDYTYPTLSFLMPNKKMSAFTCSSSLGTSRPTSDVCSDVTTATAKKEQNELHPFYKRQLLSTATPRDGLTRTRDKYRVVYTEKQRKLLEEEYQKTSFISESRRAELAKETDLSKRQIKFWFQNRRAKNKRNKKTTDNPPSVLKDKETSKALSPPSTRNSSRFQDDTKDAEISSCRYSLKKHALHQKNVCGKQDIALNTEYQQNTPNQLSLSETRDKIDTTTTGSCRYENQNIIVKTGSKSPTGCQVQKYYPVSPSEWTLANQRSYLFDRVDMSPLFNGVQPNFDFRI